MEDLTFRFFVDRCKCVNELTSTLEMYSYSDPLLNNIEEHELTRTEDFTDWLYQTGNFQPKNPLEGVEIIASLRLVIQRNACQAETFAPNVLSLQHAMYKDMVKVLHLPYQAVETSSAVGPLFWSVIVEDEDSLRLQIVYRKADVRKKGLTRGWELILSHDINNAVTTGFLKGTPSSDVVECVRHLKESILLIQHPILLPFFFFSYEMSFKTEIMQRDAREWLRVMEYALSERRLHSTETPPERYLGKDGKTDLNVINHHLTECHAQVLWKRPVSYMQIINSFEGARESFIEHIPEERRTSIRQIHATIIGRLSFHRVKLQGLENYTQITLARLEIQRQLLSTKLADRNAEKQRIEDQKSFEASQLWNRTQRIISLLAIFFLPGSFLASICSTTFFNFSAEEGTNVVSPLFWIFWAINVPVTLAVLIGYFGWDKLDKVRARKRERAGDIEEGASS